jgi:hypothetical protein
MKNWFIRFVTEPHLSRFEAAGISGAVGVMVAQPGVRGFMVVIATLISTVAIVAITNIMKDMK